MASVVVLHLLRLVGDRCVLYVEAKQKELRLACMPSKSPKEIIAEHYSSILSTEPQPAVGKLFRRHSVINQFLVV